MVPEGTMKSANSPRHCATKGPAASGRPSLLTRRHLAPGAHPVALDGTRLVNAAAALAAGIGNASSAAFASSGPAADAGGVLADGDGGAGADGWPPQPRTNRDTVRVHDHRSSWDIGGSAL